MRFMLFGRRDEMFECIKAIAGKFELEGGKIRAGAAPWNALARSVGGRRIIALRHC